MRQIVITIFVSCLVGCGSAVSRQFPVGFDRAEPELRKLYPPMLTAKVGGADELNKTSGPAAKFTGPVVTVRRNEMTNQVEQIVIEEGDITRNRVTQIVLTGDRTGNACKVSVDVSKSKTDVFFPSRDGDFEQAVLNDISAAVK